MTGSKKVVKEGWTKMKVELKDYEGRGSLFIPVFGYEAPDNLSDKHKELLVPLLKRMEGSKEKEGSLNVLDTGEIKTILVYEFGDVDKLEAEEVRRKGGTLFSSLEKLKEEEVYLHYSAPSAFEQFSQYLLEGLFLANYKFDKYKEKKDDKKEIKLNKMILFGHKGDAEELNQRIEELRIKAEGAHIARTLVNEPSNEMTPKNLAKFVEHLGEKLEFDVEVFKKDAIEDLGMDAYLSVAKGSKLKPRLIVMRYFGASEEESTLGLVGKGLTYDSGGYSIKPTPGMVNMKADMGGAAAVIGAMASIAKAQLPINVVAVVAACENMISGEAYRPGDIIGSMAGKTIEVLNTDAEGRLTLVDAVTYIQRIENVDKIVDIATLTGAKLSALGTQRAGVLSTDDAFYGKLEEAAHKTGEKVWRLPTDKDYEKLLDSKIADMKNVTKEAGCITAGLFIKKYVEDQRPWIHIDIAGNELNTGAEHYFSEGATGFGARLLYELAKEQ